MHWTRTILFRLARVALFAAHYSCSLYHRAHAYILLQIFFTSVRGLFSLL